MSKRLARKPIKRLVENIIEAYNNASQEEKTEGNQWYFFANKWSKDKACKYNVTVETVAGVVAVLSPSCGIEQNLIDAQNILASDNPKEVTVTSYNANKEKAIRIKNGEHPCKVMGGRKVKAFYDNIVNPLESIQVCVDRHALSVAFGRPLSEEERSKWNQERKHEIVENCYLLASKIIGIQPHRLQATTWISYRNSLNRKLQDATPF